MTDPSKAEIDAKLEELKFEVDEISAWIGSITKDVRISGSFHEWLRTGAVLCRLLNCVAPGSVPRISAGNIPFKQMENISMFIRGASLRPFAPCVFASTPGEPPSLPAQG